MGRLRKLLGVLLSSMVWLVGFLGRDFVQSQILPREFPDVAYLLVLTLVSGVVLVGILALVERRHAVAETLVSRVVKPDLAATWVKPAELASAVSYGRAQYPDPDDQFINEEVLSWFMRRCGQVLRLFRKNGDIVGLYIVLPLTKAASTRILSLDIQAANAFRPEHAARSYATATAVYVSNICEPV